MNSKHRRTLAAVFAEPTRANIGWDSIEAMFQALGGSVEERAGSRVCVVLNGVARVFHRPHPGNETKKAVVKNIRAFLTEAGATP